MYLLSKKMLLVRSEGDSGFELFYEQWEQWDFYSLVGWLLMLACLVLWLRPGDSVCFFSACEIRSG